MKKFEIPTAVICTIETEKIIAASDKFNTKTDKELESEGSFGARTNGTQPLEPGATLDF